MPRIWKAVLLTSLYSVLALLSGAVNAELKSLSDQDLSEVDGKGVGLVFEDFIFSHGHDPSDDKVFRITGLTSTSGEAVVVNVDQLYIARSGSNYGSTLDPVNLGRLDNPYEIGLLDGNGLGLNDEAVLQISGPGKVDASLGYDCLDTAAVQGSGECSSRPASGGWANGERPDLGLELEVNVGSETPRNLSIHAKSAVFDGSYLRLWGDGTEQKMAAEFRLNFYTPELEISTCSQANQSCGSAVKMQGFAMELAMGHTFQPLYLGADAISGGLTIEIAKITHEYINNIDVVTGQSDGTAEGDAAYAFFNDYYSNPEYRSNITMDNIEVSGTSLGSARIEGLLVQYLDVEFRDLEP